MQKIGGYWVFQITTERLRHYVPIRCENKQDAALEARRQYPFAANIQAHARLPATWPFLPFSEAAIPIEAR